MPRKPVTAAVRYIVSTVPAPVWKPESAPDYLRSTGTTANPDKAKRFPNRQQAERYAAFDAMLDVFTVLEYTPATGTVKPA